MEGAGGTASLRKAAGHWSLAGDKQLLDLLQNLQERIVTKCQEANSGLEEMVNSLDAASISLQNVNNRLMALSNSQFVESRVYEDDVDVATRDPPVKAPAPPPDPTSELARLRDSLRVLEAYHETVTILDSDSDSASDDEEDRMVLKPRDLYRERPLPYVIGSQQWRSKWHAGLVAEQSESDSDTSKAQPPSEQYSDSEPEGDAAPDRPADRLASQRTISTTSSIGSELTIPSVGKPADIAAELARRLGGNVPHIPEPEPEPPAAAAPSKVYRPQQPTTATIFSDEPPPLDAYQSDQSESEPYQSDSDDVFAELHRQAHRQTHRQTRDPVADLFGGVPSGLGRKGEFGADDRRQINPSVKQSSPLFEEPQDSELFGDKPKREEQPVYADPQPDVSVKKPVGGISLFGNNHGTESIGAAILKRNQRKASTSDEEVQEPQQIHKINNDTEKPKTRAGQNSNDNTQKDILNDLFSKPGKTKQTSKKVEKPSPVKVEKPVNKKVDLFTDDLFDDIDDIFTNVKPPVKESKQSTKKSLFDDEDDDLFANVAATSNKTNSKPEPKSKSIFDSDDDLFNEEIVENNTAKLNFGSKTKKIPLDTSNDDLFSEGINVSNKVVIQTDIQSNAEKNTTTAIKTVIKDIETEHEDSIGNTKGSENSPEEIKSLKEKSSLKGSQVKSIFDTDSDDDIFSDFKSRHNNSSPQKVDNKNTHNIYNTEQFPNKSDEYTVRKSEANNVLHSINHENQLNSQKDEFLVDDSLFKEKEKSIDAQEILPPCNESNDSKNNVNVFESEDINKKTDEVLPEILDISSEVDSNTVKEDNTIMEDKLISSTNSSEGRIQNVEKSSHSNTANAQKTFNSIKSPSLFDEDDDFDDIFSKSSDSNQSKKSDNKLEYSSNNHSSKFATNQDNICEKSREELIISKPGDVDIVPAENSDQIESIGGGQIFQSDNIEKHILENDKPHVFKDDREELIYESNINKVNNEWEVSEESLAKDGNKDNSIQIECTLEEEEENKTDDDNILEDFKQEENLFSNIKDTVLGEPDIFSDIFSDVPPEFERPKEPKRSKNVNALFDDDSDDEALFFKKNETVSDDKPDVNFASQDDRLFHIFHDEPPAIDVDFTQKPIKPLETPHNEKNALQTDAYGESKDKSVFKEEIDNEKDFDTSIYSKGEKNTDEARKPVGKLKPVNFNINVSSLLPGASPKKTKTYEQVDGQVVSSRSTENVVREEAGMVKSVSFEGDPASDILDNKLSKERVKIQVKRRPSTRRARKEAVRKSGIDFGDDSTDTSTSTDISKKDNTTTNTNNTSNTTLTSEKHINTLTDDDVLVDKHKYVDQKSSYIVDHDEVTDLSDVREEKQVKSLVEQDPELFSNVKTNTVDPIKHSDSSTSERLKQEESESSNLTTAFNKRPNVKSKVVYILNDEDIFTDTKPVTNLSNSIHKVPEIAQNNSDDVFKDTKTVTNVSENTQYVAKNKVLNIVDDDDELFKTSSSRVTNVSTLGNAYKDVNLKNNEIADLDSDEDIFKASQSKSVKNIESGKSNHEIDKMEAKIDKLFVKSQSTKVKSSLFDDLSDEENELFGSKKSVKNRDTSDKSDGTSTTIKKEVKLPKNIVKPSLFGDESDDDDLFSVRTTKKVPPQHSQPSKPKEVTSKQAEPVFEDPLSMLTQEDDI